MAVHDPTIGSRDDLLRLVFDTVTERARAGVEQAIDPLHALRRQGAGRDDAASLRDRIDELVDGVVADAAVRR